MRPPVLMNIRIALNLFGCALKFICATPLVYMSLIGYAGMKPKKKVGLETNQNAHTL